MRILVFFLLFTVSSFWYRTEAKPPQEVRTGVYLMNLYDLNMDEHSFYADFYIWFKWKGNIDPSQIEFVNAIEKWGAERSGFDGDSTAVVLPDGTKYKIIRVETRFFHSFALNNFPLDQHTLDIQFEHPDYPVDSLVYLPDTGNVAQVRRTLNLVGWEHKGTQLNNGTHDYGTNFGNPKENASKYSNITYSITLARPFSYFLLKMMLPLFLVVLVSISALLLHPAHIDTRSSLPIGGLLTAVFLQQVYTNALPDTGYMVLMDKIYLLGYIMIALTLWQIIRSGNRSIKQEHTVKSVRRERLLAFGYAVLFVLGVTMLCW